MFWDHARLLGPKTNNMIHLPQADDDIRCAHKLEQLVSLGGVKLTGAYSILASKLLRRKLWPGEHDARRAEQEEVNERTDGGARGDGVTRADGWHGQISQDRTSSTYGRTGLRVRR